MAANFEVLTWIANGCLSRFKNKTTMVGKVRRDVDDEFGRRGRKIGATFYFRRSPAFLSTSTAVSPTFADYIDPDPIPITLNNNIVIPITMTDQDYLLKFDDIDQRINAPVAEQMGTDADRLVTALYKYVGNYVGTIGTPITGSASYKSFLQARAILNKEGAPMENRWAMFDPDLEVELADYLKQFQNPTGKISDVFNEGTLTSGAGMKWGMTQDLYAHTVANGLNAVTVSGKVNNASHYYGNQSTASGNTTTIAVDTFTSSTATLAAGDIISFNGYYAVNPRTKQSLGYLRPFSVVSSVLLSGGAGNITVSPAIEPAQGASGVSNPYQNITHASTPNYLADNTDIYVWGGAAAPIKTGVQSLVFCPDAFAFANVKLPLFDGLHMAARATDPETGLSLRVSQQWDIATTALKTRLDMLCGATGLETQQAVRVTS